MLAKEGEKEGIRGEKSRKKTMRERERRGVRAENGKRVREEREREGEGALVL